MLALMRPFGPHLQLARRGYPSGDHTVAPSGYAATLTRGKHFRWMLIMNPKPRGFGIKQSSQMNYLADVQSTR